MLIGLVILVILVSIYFLCVVLIKFELKYGGNTDNMKDYYKENFVTKTNFKNKDLWITDIVKDEDQEYLNRDYRKNLEYVFPLFAESSIDPPNGMTKKEMNDFIQKSVTDGENVHWTNKTLSYAKKNVAGKQQYNAVFKHSMELADCKSMRVLDITGNIGNDSFNFALHPEVDEVITYEMQDEPFRMLKENLRMYGFDKMSIVNEKFDAVSIDFSKIFTAPKKDDQCTVVVIDPPFELGNNPDNFNFSIAAMPIEFVVENLLDAGADVVFLSVPLNFKYNTMLGEYKHTQRVSVYYMGNKNIKTYVIGKNKKLTDKKVYKIGTQYYDKTNPNIKFDIEDQYKYRLSNLTKQNSDKKDYSKKYKGK